MPETRALTYPELRTRIRTLLDDVQTEIETLKLKTYWQTGALIQQYLEGRPGSASEEAAAVERLAADLETSQSAIYRMLKFARTYADGPPEAGTLTWSHVRVLLPLSAGAAREALTKKADAKGWSVRRLRLEVQKQRGPQVKQKRKPDFTPLAEPEIKKPGVRKIKFQTLLGRATLPAVDLGFDLYEPLDAAQGRRFKENDTVVWNGEKETWVRAGAAEDLYYYEARVERVVDGDTLLVHIQVSPRVTRRQYLRLRGVNAAEAGTPEGDRASTWLRKQIDPSVPLLIQTHLTDKYDRYIADVWADGLYLNNALLAEGLVTRY